MSPATTLTPEALYRRLWDLQNDMGAMVDNPPGIDSYWTIVVVRIADLADELMDSIPGHPYAPFRLFANHAKGVLEGAVPVLSLACNSDHEAETLNTVRLTGCALGGLIHTLEKCFDLNPETVLPE